MCRNRLALECCLFVVFLAAVLLAVLAIESGGAEGRVLTVDDDGGEDFETIQDAVNASREGDTIRVHAGIYYECIVVDKTVSLVGSGRDVVTIDAQGKGDAVGITANWCNLSGFSVTSSADNDAGIRVESDNNHIFQNRCQNNFDYGIWLLSSDHSTVENNICSANGNDGIRFSGRYCTITNNTCTANRNDGIDITSALYSTITNNTCSANNNDGIQFDGRYCTLSNNRCLGNGNDGIQLGGIDSSVSISTCSANGNAGIQIIGSYCMVTNSTCSANGRDGILLSGPYSTLFNNSLSDNGMFMSGSLEHWNTHIIGVSNTVNGKPVRYFANTANLTISSGAGELLLANCSNITVKDQLCRNSSVGILVGHSSTITIENNSFQNNRDGIFLSSSSNCTVKNNTCENNSYGITIDGSHHNTISKNTCLNNVHGILLGFGSFSCTLSNNICNSNSNFGIYLTEDLGHNTLLNNSCQDNRDGVHLEKTGLSNIIEGTSCSYNTRYGIFLASSPSTRVRNNSCQDNDDGIHIFESGTVVLTGNNCSLNANNGIYLWGSDSSIVVNNSCFSNVRNGIKSSSSGEGTYKANACSRNDEDGVCFYDTHDGIIENNTITGNILSGIRLYSSDSNTIILNLILGNRRGIALLESSRGNTAIGNIIAGNSAHGILASHLHDYNISARYNWWGAGSGPYHAENNTEGEGDEVTDFVSFKPWLRSADDSPYPVAVIDSIMPNPGLITDRIHFSGSVEGNWTIDRYVWRNDTEELHNGSEPGFNVSHVAAGVHTIHFKVRDENGTWSDEVSETLVIHARPRARITVVSPGIAHEGQEVWFFGNGTDDGEVLRFVWASDKIGEIHNSTSVNFSTSDCSIGDHVITLKVQDDHGVWSDEVTVILTVHEKPTASIDSILPNPAFDTDTLLFSGKGSDDGIITAYLWDSDIDGVLFNGTAAAFNRTGLSVGIHTITFKVQDNHGVWSDEASATLVIDRYVPPNKPPAVSFNSPENGSKVRGMVTINGTATDEDGVIEKVELSINGGEWMPVAVGSLWSYDWDTTTVKDGEYEIKLRAFDGELHSKILVRNVKVENEGENDGSPESDHPVSLLLVFAIGIVSSCAYMARKRRRGSLPKK